MRTIAGTRNEKEEKEKKTSRTYLIHRGEGRRGGHVESMDNIDE